MKAEDFAFRLNAKKVRGYWIARCPAHNDHSPSLKISVGRDGRILLHCWAGCENRDIVGALGLRMRDLFASNPPSRADRAAMRRQERQQWKQHQIERLHAIRERERERAKLLRNPVDLPPTALTWESLYGDSKPPVDTPAHH
jgi:DNA primase